MMRGNCTPCDLDRVVEFNAELPNRALDLRMTEEEPRNSQIACPMKRIGTERREAAADR